MTASAPIATDCRAMLCTANQPGAIAMIELLGDAQALLESLTTCTDWPIGRLRLVRFAGIDEGLAGQVDDHCALLMPHGGPRVVQRLMERLVELGCAIADDESTDVMELYPEASDPIEALMLHALARAHSPLAIDLLLDQPRRWREQNAGTAGNLDMEAMRYRSNRLNRLIDPPLIVLAGPANVGKSTLSNALLGGEMSIALDQPGMTRDYTARLIDLGGLVVRWIDTPGLRDTTDPIEQHAISLARRLMDRADLLIAITDHEHDWPRLPRPPELSVANKCDVDVRSDAELSVSAADGQNIPELVARLRDTLVPRQDREHPGPWLFDRRIAEMFQIPIEL